MGPKVAQKGLEIKGQSVSLSELFPPKGKEWEPLERFAILFRP